MEAERKSKPNFLRWLAVLPGAMIAMFLSMFPLHLVLYQTLTGSGLIEPYPEMPERLLGPLAAAIGRGRGLHQVERSRRQSYFLEHRFCYPAQL
jgi:hypothetical protein